MLNYVGRCPLLGREKFCGLTWSSKILALSTGSLARHRHLSYHLCVLSDFLHVADFLHVEVRMGKPCLQVGSLAPESSDLLESLILLKQLESGPPLQWE